MIKKDMCIVLDTETVGGFDSPIIHDLGYKIVDKHFDTMTAKRFLIKELHESAYALLRTSDFYVGKEALYKEAKANKTVKIVSFNEAITEMFNDIKEYKVNCICAYNLGFDLRALRSTYALFNEANNEAIIKKLHKLATLCIWSLACDTVLDTDNYRAFAKANNLVKEETGNYLTSAEACYRYLFNSTYEEEHTALADVEDETMILKYIIENFKGRVNYEINGQCWRKVQR